MKTYAYLRLSTNEEKQKNSFEVQRHEIEQKYKIDKYYQESISGSAPLQRRTALLSLLDDLKPDDKIIIMRFDRLSRDTVQSGWIRHEIIRKGAELISIENDTKDRTSKLIENILLSFAEFEKETTRWRINKTFENKRRKGEALGGKHPPFGYDFGYDDLGVKILIPNPHEQPIIKKVMRFRAKGSRDIARVLSAQSITNKQGNIITPKQVERIIRRQKRLSY